MPYMCTLMIVEQSCVGLQSYTYCGQLILMLSNVICHQQHQRQPIRASQAPVALSQHVEYYENVQCVNAYLGTMVPLLTVAPNASPILTVPSIWRVWVKSVWIHVWVPVVSWPSVMWWTIIHCAHVLGATPVTPTSSVSFRVSLSAFTFVIEPWQLDFSFYPEICVRCRSKFILNSRRQLKLVPEDFRQISKFSATSIVVSGLKKNTVWWLHVPGDAMHWF